MANELSLENIEQPAGWDLFNDPNGGGAAGGQQEPPKEGNGGQQEPPAEQQPAEGVRIPDDQLFPAEKGEENNGGGASSESVGGEENNKGMSTPPAGSGGEESSANFYSSWADAFRKDGVLESLGDDDVKGIIDGDSMNEAIEKEVRARLDERYRILDEARGVNADMVALDQAQQNLQFLNGVKPEDLDDDNDPNIGQLRKDLIVNHYISMGMTREQAEYELKKSIDTNNDVRDAKNALEMQKRFFQGEVDRIVGDARKQEEAKRNEMKERQKRVTDNIMNNKDIFGSVSIDKRVREKIVDAIYTPKYRDENDNWYSELQRFQQEHPDECVQLLGMIYVLTDGGKDMAKMTNAIAKREKSSYVKNLEKVMRGQNSSGGGLRFVENGRGEQSGKAADFTPVF